ncbi:MAG: glycosyltransferase family 1 protein [Anaerolineales bacterium]|nr:glycosyltransferase family 1 protein [Anaerolineales bacterium]
MTIAIMALGTRGDVQPYVALAVGLQSAGHTVRVITHENYERLVRAYGLEFWPVYGDVQAVAESPEIQALLEKGDFLAINARTAKLAEQASLSWAKDSLAACRDAQLLVAGVGGLFLALALAEKLNLPLMQAYVFPFTPTRTFPAALFPKAWANLGGAANAFSHHTLRQIMWQGSRAADKVARQQVLNLPAAPFFGPYQSHRLNGHPVLYGISPAVIAPPPDWQNTHVTGYWFLEAEPAWTPPAELERFLQAGPPPVYVGFGSMSNRKPEQTTELILHALRQTQQRAILLSGWNGLRKKNLPETVYLLDSAPHSWLFSRVAAVVHHGGAGTTAAGLRAGVPSIIIPFFADQPFWGARVADLGVGPAPIPRPQLTAERLAQALAQATTNRALQQRAAQLGERIRAEDGVAQAVTVIDTVLSRSKSTVAA